MPPSVQLTSLRPDIAGSFEEFDLEMDRRGFIGMQVMPAFESQMQAGTVGKIKLEDLLQNRNIDRAPGGGYSRGDWTFEDWDFATKERGAEEPIDDREAQMYSLFFDYEVVCAARAFDAVLRGQEKRAADLIFNGTTWTGSSLKTAVSNEWDDSTNAEPIDDVEAAVRKVYANSGLMPNALVINRFVFRNLRESAQVRARIVSSGAGNPEKARDVTVEMLKAVFDLDHILVAGSSKNGANEGQAATPSMIWSSEYAMVCRIAETNDIKEPCIGRTFHWGADGSQIGGTFETYRDETVRSDIARARHDVQEKVMYVEMGHLLENITT